MAKSVAVPTAQGQFMFLASWYEAASPSQQRPQAGNGFAAKEELEIIEIRQVTINVFVFAIMVSFFEKTFVLT